jgi:F-type H+-transporting ATPase subunit delta
MVQKIFSGKLNDLTIDFLRAVIRHNRMVFLPQIVNRYNELWEAHHGYKIVQVTVSDAMSSQETERLSADMAQAMKNKVKLQIGVNPSIMGGIIIRYGDRVIDNSIRGRLRRAIGAIMSRPKRRGKADEV